MRSWTLVAGGLAAGLLAGFLVWGSGPGTTPRGTNAFDSDPGGQKARIIGDRDLVPATDEPREQSREDLAREIARSAALEAQVEALRQQLEAAVVPEAGNREPGAAESATTEDETAASQGGIDPDILLAAGFDPSEVADIRKHLEETELERLFVRDQAGREGWLRTQRFWNETIRLNQRQLELRDEYGDNAYDWILYAMGRENRVVASGVIQDSPASRVGLEVGDVIVAYAGQRIRAPHELQRAVLEGLPGDNAALDVERDGETRRFYLPVGPIGIRLDTLQQAPRDPR